MLRPKKSRQKALPQLLTVKGIGILWFKKRTVIVPPNRPGDTPSKKLKARETAEAIQTYLDQEIRLGAELDLSEVLPHSFIPPISAFGALPYSIYRHGEARGKFISKALRAAEANSPGVHIATVADLLWLLPQMKHMLTSNAVFFAPTRGLNEVSTEPVPICLFERKRWRRGDPAPRWTVRITDDRTRSYRGAFPVVLLTFRKPPIPRLAVYYPEPIANRGV